MPLAGRNRLADIGDFLAALRTSGVPVGPGELDHLRYLFGREPRLDRDGLKSLLGMLLVKTPEQRKTFEALFADWCPDRDADWPEETETASPRTTQPRPSSPSTAQPDLREGAHEPPPHKPWWLWPGLRAAALLVGLLVWRGLPVPPVVESDVFTVPAPTPTKTAAPPELPADPVDKVWFWRTEIDPKAVTVPPRLEWPWLMLLGLVALALALAMWRRYRQRFPEIKPQPPRRYLGFGWQPLPPPDRDEGALVDARDRRQLVWNIERFVSDDPTRRLDLPETVDATARAAGFMRLCFEPAVYDREIWFWLDRQLARPTPWAAVEQLLAILTNAGLQARRGFFTELPLRVDWPAQPGYRPEVEEGQGRQALVAILSDGEGVVRRLGNLQDAVPSERLLRGLRRWPRLCFVDCSAEGNRLAPLLAPYGIDVIALEQLPYWLGGVDAPARPATSLGTALHGDTRAWAAAVALGGAQADSAGAQSLRAELGLAVNPWRVDQVLTEAQQDRYALINWLLRCEPRGDDGLPRPGSLAQRALLWWQQRYRDAAQQMRKRENPLLPWRDSLASRRWQLEQALLRLYFDPESAAVRLAQLADEELRDEIRERLAEFAAADHRPAKPGDDVYIYLPWRLDELTDMTRHRLRRLGFADNLYRREPPSLAKYASQLVLAVCALIALALAAFAVAGYRWFMPNLPELMVQNTDIEQAVRAAPTVSLVEDLGNDRYRVTVGSARHTTSVEVAAGARVPVNWSWGKDGEAGEDNAVRLAGSASVVLRAGRLAQPIRACGKDWPLRSLVVIARPYKDDPAARQLAIRLLDRGSADQVLLGPDWADQLENWLGPSTELNQNTQLLVVLSDSAAVDSAVASVSAHPGRWAVTSTSDFAKLAEALGFWKEGAKPVDQIEQLTVHGAQGKVRIAGGPGWQSDARTGIEWVSVCSGTFTMGDDTSQTVTLSEFQIARTETTNEQYHDKGDTLPVVNVNWADARKFCETAGGDLPTDAQWEYAARGGSRFNWSFGDDEEQLGNYAWFKENSSDQAHEVAQKLPNPLGLYDMHGNIWEWGRDRYGNLAAGVFVDPPGPDSGIGRVLRGGSFGGSPADLRSSRRVEVEGLEVRGRRFGFRCVRVPPQP